MTAELGTASPLAPSRRSAWLVLCVALVARSSVLVAEFSSLAHDPDSYRQLAENLVSHGTFGFGEQPTAYRSPLWPLVLVPCVIGAEGVELRIALMQFLLGLATVGVVWWLARVWDVGRAGWLAPLLVAIDPILLRQSTVVMTETLATLFATLSLATLTWYACNPSSRRAAVVGACIGLACLSRPTFLLWFAVVPVLSLIGAKDRRGEALTQSLYMLAAGVVVLLPWTARNYVAFAKPIVGTTHGGYTLLLGNNPSFYEYARDGAWGHAWDATSFQAELARDLPAWTSPAAELERDRLTYEQAHHHIETERADFLRAAVLRLGYLFSPLPHQLGATQTAAQASVRLSIAVFYLVEFALALLGILYLRRRLFRAPWIWGLSLVACFAAVHLFYWTDMRMRAPLVPVIALLAAAGANALPRRNAAP